MSRPVCSDTRHPLPLLPSSAPATLTLLFPYYTKPVSPGGPLHLFSHSSKLILSHPACLCLNVTTSERLSLNHLAKRVSSPDYILLNPRILLISPLIEICHDIVFLFFVCLSYLNVICIRLMTVLFGAVSSGLRAVTGT